jgi:hypothetical protein
MRWERFRKEESGPELSEFGRTFINIIVYDNTLF